MTMIPNQFSEVRAAHVALIARGAGSNPLEAHPSEANGAADERGR
jgi:hypothetical protein